MKIVSCWFGLVLLLSLASYGNGFSFEAESKEIVTTAKAGPVHAEFKARNTGQVTVKILKIEPSCDCTTAKSDKQELAPGEEATISADMKVTRPGVRIITISVETDDKEKPVTVLHLVARINPDKTAASASSATPSPSAAAQASHKQ